MRDCVVRNRDVSCTATILFVFTKDITNANIKSTVDCMCVIDTGTVNYTIIVQRGDPGVCGEVVSRGNGGSVDQ